MAGDYLRRGVAEFIGTFALIFVGAGSVIYGDLVAVAFAHGLVIAVMVSAVGMISGGFFNPAVTIGFLITRRIAPALAAFYLVVQFGAATLAALMLKWILPATAENGGRLGAPLLGSGISTGKGVAVEAVLTFFLVWVIFATAVDPRGSFKQIAGLAIGLTITLDAFMGLGLTGAVVNPARAFGPQLVGDHWAHFWVWYVGPIAGAAIAALLYEGLFLSGPVEPELVEEVQALSADPAVGTAAAE